MPGGRARLRVLVAAPIVFAVLSADPGAGQERAVDGDPVDLFTGLHTREHDDIVVHGTPEIRLTRSYRNRDPASRAFGIGTSHSYDLYLVGDAVAFDQVLLVGEGASVKVGAPLLPGGKVEAKVVSQGREDKITIIKFRRRKHYRRTQGHRQPFTEVEITAISGA